MYEFKLKRACVAYEPTASQSEHVTARFQIGTCRQNEFMQLLHAVVRHYSILENSPWARSLQYGIRVWRFQMRVVRPKLHETSSHIQMYARRP